MAKKISTIYILAAGRHKYVCEQLLALQELNELCISSPQVLTTRQTQLLSDIYYLTGYIIECACCSAIYSFYPKIAHKRHLDTNIKDKDNKTRNVKWSTENQSTFSLVGEWDHKLHHFTQFPDYFTSNPIPILNGNLTVFDNKGCRDLLDSFWAEIRYELKSPQGNNIVLSYDKVKAFYEIAAQIYQQVSQKFKP